ncbi:MAG TPA: nucleoside-diphosphate kinase [Candidatus Nanoarchaeia archaeon]|nr:nucleoside-diphosphate kinase [Candidatus Nanoarchaeia archaeon]
MTLESTIGIIKPDAFQHRDKICDMIREAGLIVSMGKITVIPKGIIDELYGHVPENVKVALRHYMCQDLSELLLINGEDAIARLVKVRGEKSDSALCEEGTVRKLYGSPTIQVDEKTKYFPNALHCPMTPEEAKAQLPLFDKVSMGKYRI